MSLGTFSFGPYTATYSPNTNAAGSGAGAVDLGLVEGVRRLRRAPAAKMLQSDYYGPGTDIEGIFQGGNCFLSMVFKEWKAINKYAIWPYATDIGAVGQVGRQLTDLAGILVLTAVNGTLAASNGPVTITANLAIIAPNTDVEILLGTDARDIPVTFQLLPYNASGTVRWFSVT